MQGGKYHKGVARVRHGDDTFNAPIKWNKKPWVCDRCGFLYKDDRGRCEVDQCRLHVANGGGIDGQGTEHCNCVTFHRRRVFSLSLGDWLDDEVPIEWLADMLDVIRRCPKLDFLLLTKRPENFWNRIAKCVGHFEGPGDEGDTVKTEIGDWLAGWLDTQDNPAIPTNIWLGVSVENQATADERIPNLLQIPAAVRFVSYEPALEAVDFHLCKSGIQHRDDFTGNPDHPTWMNQVNWIIVGGESGADARPCNVEWARSTIDQCKAAGTACFIKQMGSNCRKELSLTEALDEDVASDRWVLKDKKGGDMAEWPEDLRIREFPEVKP